MTKTYNNYVLDYIQDGINHLNYDYGQASAIINGSLWEESTKTSAATSLINFKEKNFTDLQYNIADGRVWNEFVGMKSDLRVAFKYKNMVLKLHFYFVMIDQIHI